MRKLLRNIALCLAPILLYFAVFVAFEPNNYFGLRAEPLRGDDIIARMRSYVDDPKDAVIVGDSRLAQLEPAALEDAFGQPFANLAYGGASLTDILDMLEWLVEQNPELDEIILGLSYYTLNAGFSHDHTVVEAMRNPFVYMTNLTYNVNMLETLALVLQNALREMRGEEPIPLGGGEAETLDPSEYVYAEAQDPMTGEIVQVRQDLLNYAVNNIGERGKYWKLDTEELERLVDIADLCEINGVRLTIVLPPFDDSVRRFVIAPYGIEAQMLPALEKLRATSAQVLDYEFSQNPHYPDDMFFDGFHLDVRRGLPVWTDQLIEDMETA